MIYVSSRDVFLIPDQCVTVLRAAGGGEIDLASNIWFVVYCCLECKYLVLCLTVRIQIRCPEELRAAGVGENHSAHCITIVGVLRWKGQSYKVCDIMGVTLYTSGYFHSCVGSKSD